MKELHLLKKELEEARREKLEKQTKQVDTKVTKAISLKRRENVERGDDNLNEGVPSN